MAKKIKIVRTEFHKDPSWSDGPYKPVTASNVVGLSDAWSTLLNVFNTWYQNAQQDANTSSIDINLEMFDDGEVT